LHSSQKDSQQGTRLMRTSFKWREKVAHTDRPCEFRLFLRRSPIDMLGFAVLSPSATLHFGLLCVLLVGTLPFGLRR
jgi:hypothetical protein